MLNFISVKVIHFRLCLSAILLFHGRLLCSYRTWNLMKWNLNMDHKDVKKILGYLHRWCRHCILWSDVLQGPWNKRKIRWRPYFIFAMKSINQGNYETHTKNRIQKGKEIISKHCSVYSCFSIGVKDISEWLKNHIWWKDRSLFFSSFFPSKINCLFCMGCRFTGTSTFITLSLSLKLNLRGLLYFHLIDYIQDLHTGYK